MVSSMGSHFGHAASSSVSVVKAFLSSVRSSSEKTPDLHGEVAATSVATEKIIPKSGDRFHWKMVKKN